MLIELVKEEVIRLNFKAENSEEAIRCAGQMLVETGKVTSNYVDEMVKMSQEIKGYIVLAPGIAMPHARPEYGVKEIGLSILTLSTPIPFGNDANDPVKLVIALAAKDNTTHLKLLQELSLMLDNDSIVEEFSNCQNSQDALDIVRTFAS
ncbi:MAG: hypothetical protein PWP16_845 [Eubacteriaceae bacterium]|jgi:mannitol/fructose-specific phosphotransferase system IIA component (Ntr-type)|nr:hypothetical protein [Eubacteriaceae bacterium]MDK2904592.1 hypothetical protein [Eubacteriaceae bacterium]MDK2937113.1 hypothetical protein [Eubacteriaceae bacterium]MDK2961332.1 hypothetical protein [Eubacteriaceae bacterium]MDN5307482.1 hypothetical protein [Eubacteriaceae bacterium]